MASTQSTDSDAAGVPRYRFTFSWDGPYGHALRLLERLRPKPGFILDLGCGFGAIAEPLAERGYHYIGVDRDENALSQLSTRGFEVHQLDLTRTADLADLIAEIAGARYVAAVFALDVLEHLPQTPTFLDALRKALDRLGRPPVIVSVPNVSHMDIAAKLVFGRWDYTSTGLLDSTHVSLFTAHRLRSETRACGLVELDAFDYLQPVSDQRFPIDHPALVDGSPVAQLLRAWRESADEHGSTNQFIRAFYATDLDTATDAPDRPCSMIPSAIGELTVVMRTQGRRLPTLRDALTCLAAQTIDGFNVYLMVHSDDLSTVETVTGLVGEFDESFAARVSVLHVGLGGGRARPLNVALDRLESEYVAFLDDDDLVTADWAESFCEISGECAVIRSQSARRYIGPASDPASAPYVPRSGLEFPFSPTFDFAEHLWQNQTPICAYAVPRALIETFALRFDEELSVLEDWAYLLRCASIAEVRDTGKLTSIGHVWVEGESSRSLHTEDYWLSVERVRRERMNTQPLLLPAGSVARLVELRQERADLYGELQAVRPEAERLRAEAERARAEARTVSGELAELRHRYLITVQSRRWRVLGPIARMIEASRRWRRGSR
jgi:SAM-dependent methyltransferase